MEKATTVKRVLDKRWMKKESKTYHLAIRVTHDRKQRIFPLDLEVTESDFKKLAAPHLGETLAGVKKIWQEAEKRAGDIIKELGTFTFLAFQEVFYKDSPNRQNKGRLKKLRANSNGNNSTLKELPATQDDAIRGNAAIPAEGKNRKYGKRKYDRIRSNIDFAAMGPLAVLYGAYIKTLEAQARIGTSEVYFRSLLSLLKYRPCLRVEDMTVNFLYAYEQWFLGQGRSETTVGIYLRPLRCILNIQKEAGMLLEKDYPFGRRKYVIPAGENFKIALELHEVRALWQYQYQILDVQELFYLAIWFFGLFANGINPKDIINLKYGNFYGNFIVIQRQKTRRVTRAKPKKITIPINEPMNRIIRRFGNPDRAPQNYVFNILRPGLSPHRQHELNNDFTCTIIDWMKKIGPKAGIEKKITTKTWRHSYASLLRHNLGIATEFIMGAFAHNDLETTENYMADFELGVKARVTQQLTDLVEGPAVGSCAGF